MPAFSNNAIRRFKCNVSGQTHIAARQLEDIIQVLTPQRWSKYDSHNIQCSMPAFEGLIPTAEHDRTIQKMLFCLNRVHSCAKLTLHTVDTKASMGDAVRELGKALRNFDMSVCPVYATRELPQDETAYKGASRKGKEKAARMVTFNMATTKMAVLEHYALTLEVLTLDHFSASRVRFYQALHS